MRAAPTSAASRARRVLLGAKATSAADFSDAVMLPSWDELQADKTHLMRLTKVVEAQQTPFCGKRMVQMHGNRAVVMEPPAMPVDGPDLDALYELPFQRRPHPSYIDAVPAFATVKDSIVVSRGCAGGCTYCGLGLHQGKFLSSRSVDSVLEEVRTLAASDDVSRHGLRPRRSHGESLRRAERTCGGVQGVPPSQLPLAGDLPAPRHR